MATVYQEGRVAIIAALLIILGAIVLAWRFARGISRPLSGLVKEAESIRHFDFGQTVPLPLPARSSDTAPSEDPETSPEP